MPSGPMFERQAPALDFTILGPVLHESTAKRTRAFVSAFLATSALLGRGSVVGGVADLPKGLAGVRAVHRPWPRYPYLRVNGVGPEVPSPPVGAGLSVLSVSTAVVDVAHVSCGPATAVVGRAAHRLEICMHRHRAREQKGAVRPAPRRRCWAVVPLRASLLGLGPGAQLLARAGHLAATVRRSGGGPGVAAALEPRRHGGLGEGVATPGPPQLKLWARLVEGQARRGSTEVGDGTPCSI